MADDLAAVIEVAGEAVKLPRKNSVSLASLDAAKHVVPDWTARLLGAFAFSERPGDGQTLLQCDGVQFGKLGFDGQNLTVFIFARLTRIYEVFEHRQSVANDFNNCENKMTRIAQFTISNDLLKRARGTSAAERLVHRLHSVALVASGLSASEAARIYGDSPRAVAYWVTRYKKLGLKGLSEESRPGRPSRLSPSDMKKLQLFVRQSRARSQVVNANVLTKYIKTTFGVTFTVRQCWRILKRLKSSSV